MYVIWSLGLGGAEQMVIRLAAGLDRRRFAPLIVCLNTPGPFAEQAAREGLEVIALHKRGPWDLRVLFGLAALMRTRRIDVVHTHLWGANLWGRSAARFAKVPVVITTEHNVDIWKPTYYFMLDRFLARWTSKLIGVSQQVRDFYEARGVGRGRWDVIYNGVAVPSGTPRGRDGRYAALGISSEEPVVGWVGRFVSAKAPERFVEVVARALERIPTLRALMVGDGPLRPHIEAQLRRLGLEGRISITGMRHDVPELLRGMDALVFSSEREGFSMAMLEAMAAGVPVVATRVGGTPELIESGVSGILVPPGNPQALADETVALLQDSWKARAMTWAARERVQQQFSLRRMIEAHEAIYCRDKRHETGDMSHVPCPMSQPSRSIKICYIIDDLGPGGAQQQLRWLLSRLDRQQFEPVVISLSVEKTTLQQAIQDLRVEVITIPQQGAVDLRAFGQLYRVLRRGRFTIVQTCLFTADLYGRLAAWLARVPVRVSSVRSVETDKPRHYVWVDQLLAPLTHRFIANAACVGQVLRERERIPGEKIVRVYNGIVVNGMRPQRNGSPFVTIGSVGRLDAVKGHDLLVKAFARLHASDGRLRLLLVGDGPERSRLASLARTLGVEPCVEFVGYQANVAPWLNRMDCFVLPSHYEGCSNALLEAMAVGLPVIATAVGGNPELIENGVSGWLIPDGDEAALVEAIRRVCVNPDLAQAMATRARARVQAQFNVNQMVEETVAVYRSLLQRPLRREEDGIHVKA